MQMESADRIREARATYGRQLRASLEGIVAILAAMDEVLRISVFGSYARGRADLFTDLDVLVVMKTDEGILERLGRLYSLVAAPVDLDLLCYTPEEFETMKQRPFLRYILREERILYEK
jgi:predicted nucleotidyltransferase